MILRHKQTTSSHARKNTRNVPLLKELYLLRLDFGHNINLKVLDIKIELVTFHYKLCLR